MDGRSIGRPQVYISDDSAYGSYYKFVADAPRDLSAGRLYAAKMTQTSAVEGGAFNVSSSCRSRW